MIYTIPQGSHYCNGRSIGGIHTGTRSMVRSVKFDQSCIYQLSNPDCIDDVNKLFGFSYGLHHTNSVRIGWRCKDGQITLFGYCYSGGHVSTKFIKRIKAGLWYTCDIYVGDGYVRYRVNDTEVYHTLSYSPCAGYYLYPYFGGTCSAPQTMTIQLEIP